MDFQETLDELNITLGDTENVTFTPEEKTRALRKAWNDSYVVDTVFDDTGSFTAGTYNYALPAGMTTISDVFISPSNSTSNAPTTIDSNYYEVSGGNLRFRNDASVYTSSGYGYTVKGYKKLDPDSDTLDTPNLQEYVIALAGFNTLTALGFKKANLFLKNDTTMAELISLRRELEQEVIRLRGKLQRSFESA